MASVSGLELAGVDGAVREDLRRFLDQCDMVKFAKVRPTAEASEAVLELGRRVVSATTPAVVIPDMDVEEEGAARALPEPAEAR